LPVTANRRPASTISEAPATSIRRRPTRSAVVVSQSGSPCLPRLRPVYPAEGWYGSPPAPAGPGRDRFVHRAPPDGPARECDPGRRGCGESELELHGLAAPSAVRVLGTASQAYARTCPAARFVPASVTRTSSPHPGPHASPVTAHAGDGFREVATCSPVAARHSRATASSPDARYLPSGGERDGVCGPPVPGRQLLDGALIGQAPAAVPVDRRESRVS
jgi:hypothetical protein